MPESNTDRMWGVVAALAVGFALYGIFNVGFKGIGDALITKVTEFLEAVVPVVS